jgi:hypothetical protein
MRIRVIGVVSGLVLGGLTMGPARAADPNPPTPGAINGGMDVRPDQMSGATTRPQGQLVTDSSEAKAIRNVLAEVTEAAVTKNGMSTIIGDLSKADRDRLDKEKDNKYDDLNQAAAQFQQDWKDKYHSDFKIHDVNQVFTDEVPIYQGYLPQLNGSSAPMPTSGGQPGRDQKLAATVFFAANGDAKLPALQIYLFNEGTILNSWKIEEPGRIDSAQLHQALLARLNRLHDQRGQWPDNQDTAARLVSQTVMVAVSQASGGSQAMSPAQNSGGAQANTDANR